MQIKLSIEDGTAIVNKKISTEDRTVILHSKLNSTVILNEKLSTEIKLKLNKKIKFRFL